MGDRPEDEGQHEADDDRGDQRRVMRHASPDEFTAIGAGLVLYATRAEDVSTERAAGRSPTSWPKRKPRIGAGLSDDDAAAAQAPGCGSGSRPVGPTALARIVARRRAAGRHRRARPRGVGAVVGPTLIGSPRISAFTSSPESVSYSSRALASVCRSSSLLGQDPARRGFALVDQAADLLVDQLGGRVGDVLALRHRMAEEHLFLVARCSAAARASRTCRTPSPWRGRGWSPAGCRWRRRW